MEKLKKKIFGIEAAATLLFVSILSGCALGTNDTNNRTGIHNLDANDLFETVENENSVQISDERTDTSLSTNNNFNTASKQSGDLNEKIQNFEEIIKELQAKGTFPSSITAEDINNISKFLSSEKEFKKNQTSLVGNFFFLMSGICFAIGLVLLYIGAQVAYLFLALGWLFYTLFKSDSSYQQGFSLNTS